MPAEAQLAWNAIGEARRKLLQTTGFLALRLRKPSSVKKGTFTWHKRPPDDAGGDLRWVIDGFALDPAWPQLATCGFAIVATTRHGELVAWGSGVAPEMVDSSAAAEAWALLTCVQSEPDISRVITDCASLRTTARAGVGDKRR